MSANTPAWTSRSIAELCSRVTSGGTPSRLRAEFYHPATIPWVRTGDLDDAPITYYSEFISESGVAESSAKLLPAGTVLMAMYGATVGKLGLLREPATCNQASCAMIVDPASCDSRWLFYALLNAREMIISRANGAAQQNLSGTTIKTFHFMTPSLGEQRAIAEVLGALDDKIAANTKLIALLDTHMALEYTAAVDIEPEFAPLAAVAKFHNRLRVPLSAREREQRQGNIPYYGASGIFGSVDEAIFNEPLVLVGEDGSVIKADGTPVIQYIWGPAWVNNHAHVLTGVGLSTEVLYLAIARSQVANLVTGAVQPKINMGNLKSLMLELPAEGNRMRLESIVGAETASKRALADEIKVLTATRDALLPQLMSGKLRVKDAEKVLEEAGV